MAIPRHIIIIHAAALIGFLPMMLAATIDHEKKADTQTVTQAKASEQVQTHRLIGFGCEAKPGDPMVKTMVANEEDEFPGQCREIVATSEACVVATTDGEVELLGEACAAYWGDGY